MKTSVKWVGFAVMVILIVFSAIIFDKCNKGKISMPKLVYTNSSTNSNSIAVVNQVPDGNLILKLGGESVMAETFAPNLIKGYMEKNGYKNVSIANVKNGGTFITGEKGGSKDKIEILPKEDNVSYLDKGDIDIYMTSTELTHSNYKEYQVGMDAIAIIVNKNSTLKSISMGDLKDVFTSAKMTLYCNSDNSCTQKTFKEFVMEDKQIHTSTQKLSSDADVMDAISKDENGIGIISYSKLNSSVKAIPIADAVGLAPIIPNKSTIESERYPLSKDLYFYISKKSTLAQNLASYIESSEGQKLVQDEGFVNLEITLNDNSANPEAMPNDPPAYTALINNDVKVTTEFRFLFGSSTLDSRGLNDVTRLVEYLSDKQNSGEKVILAGFTDNVGDPVKNNALSLQRANSVKAILTASGVNVYQTLGFGSARPVRSNDNEEDRDENRRVEVWLKK